MSARNGREWIGDVIKPKKSTSSLLQIQGSSSTINHHKLIAASDPVPHKTARASRSRFSYSFRVSPGHKILHLHFNPSPYRGFQGLKDLFTVEAGPFILLSNFSASLTAAADVLSATNSFSKEFYLNIQEDKQLNLTFSPEASDTYAFINGIEIISVPEGVSYFQGGGDIEVKVVGHESPVYVDQYTALEVIHRLNIRHTSQISGDFDGTLPMWAMRKENNVKNETWKIVVGVGFRYMIRLHFSETGLKIAAASGDVMMFKVLVNEMTAHTNIELWKEMDGDENYNIPWYKDYLVMMRGQRKEGTRDLLISLHSYDDFIDGRGLISGFEIFKLSNPDNSLACPNPVPPAHDSPSHPFQVLISVFGHKNGCSLIAITLISLVTIIVHRVRELWEAAANSSKEKPKPSARADQLCRRFSLTEIHLATRNFSNELLIGRGGFGKVYKGIIDGVQTKTVAVKRLKSNSMQGVREFLMEIETLAELRHVNLVSLIGYCNEHREMILVYDFMANGTLSDHLHKLTCSPLLTWKQRLNICIGAGRGLDYLHTGHRVIHRDVKTSNILLDQNFVAKVSDFGLAKHEDRNKLQQSHVSTRVKGTNEYLDPHYLHTRKLTRKTDIYAFGVVLFEVLCGRPVVDLSVAEDEHILTIWARHMVNAGEVDRIVASGLREEISLSSMKTFVEVAERCLRDEPKNRPTMSQVVQQLEFALEQHARSQILAQKKKTIRTFGNGLSVTREGQPAMSAFTTVQNPMSSSKIVNDEITFSRNVGRNSTMLKLSRLLPRDGFWNKDKSLGNEGLVSAVEDPKLHPGQLKRFSLPILQLATDNFSYKSILGRGGFGKVYKGRLADGSLVAVKRLMEERTQGGELQFQTQVQITSMALHRNLLRLCGFCTTPTERLLVYPYMANGSVASCLRARPESQPPLDWPKRKRIALGCAAGLAYLHENCHHKIIHRDVKAANILLDEDFEAVVGEFGFAKLMDYKDTHVTTAVVGTIGHIAPEYLSTDKASEKSDVFGYGVMLLELISGQTTSDLAKLANNDDVMLLDWVKRLLKEKNLETLIDADLQKYCMYEEVKELIQVAILCSQSSPMKRPKMSEVVRMLEGDGLAERWEECKREESI